MVRGAFEFEDMDLGAIDHFRTMVDGGNLLEAAGNIVTPGGAHFDFRGKRQILAENRTFVGLIDEFLELGIRFGSFTSAVWARICSFTADEAVLARSFALSQETKARASSGMGMIRVFMVCS